MFLTELLQEFLQESMQEFLKVFLEELLQEFFKDKIIKKTLELVWETPLVEFLKRNLKICTGTLEMFLKKSQRKFQKQFIEDLLKKC